jgi:hypothetical protein
VKSELNELIMHPVVVSVAGAFVGLRALPGESRLQRMSTLVSGALTAIFGGPALVSYLGIQNSQVGAGVIFITGAVGLVALGAIWEGIKQTQLGAWLQSWLPTRRPQGGKDGA